MKIAHYKGRSRLFNRLVSWWMRGPYSHTEAVLVDDYSGTGMSLCASSSFMDGGVRIKLIRLDPEHWDVTDVPGWDAQQALAWFRAHLGQRYDTLGLLGFVYRRVTGDQSAWYCNEAVGAAVGVPEPWRFDPNSFAALSAAIAEVPVCAG